MSTDYKFTGWVAHDKDAINGNMKWEEFKPKTWEEDDGPSAMSNGSLHVADNTISRHRNHPQWNLRQ